MLSCDFAFKDLTLALLLDGKVGVADFNSNNTIMKKKFVNSTLAFFSHKIGIGGQLEVKEQTMIVNQGKEDEMEVWGYKLCPVKYLATIIGILLTGGLLGLPLYWWKKLWLQFTRVQCSLEEATSVLVVVSIKSQ